MFLMTRTLMILAAVASPPPDRIMVNALVHTMDEKRPKAEAIAITSGRISAVGSTSAILASQGPRTEVMDLRGATVVPGLKESHGHFIGIGEARMSGHDEAASLSGLQTDGWGATALPDLEWK